MGIRSQNNPIAAYLDVFSRSGTDAATAGGVAGGLTASGGIINDYTVNSDVYRTHIFTSSGTFEVTSLASDSSIPNNLEYLVVAGGGGGGGESAQSGGGGAGGFRTNLTGHPVKAADYTAEVGTYTVTVGAGGLGGNGPASPGGKFGLQGGNSEFFPTPVSYPSTKRVRSVGGGGGMGYAGSPVPQMNGGSGGGATCSPTPYAGGTGNTTDPNHPQVQGYAGGDCTPSYVSPYAGGGGGGAGRVGAPDNPSTPLTRSTGGYGLQCLIAGPPSTPQPIGAPGPGSGAAATGYFAGGGGGGSYGAGGGAGGYGGGADGGGTNIPSKNGPHAAASTGGGGGGSGYVSSYGHGGNGGSGVVAVRYKIGELTGIAKATGGAISFYGGKTIHKFTNSGTFVCPGPFSETCEYVVIGGGGSGGSGSANTNSGGGGGGAGTYRTGSVSVSNGTYNITIGAGGGKNNGSNNGSQGSTTTLALPSSVASPGGGYGYPGPTPGYNGGSSGGTITQSTTATGAPFPGTIGITPSSGWGHIGNNAPSVPAYNGGGGGGAGGAAPPQTGANLSPGGLGIQIPSTFRNPASTVGAPGPTSPGVTGADNSGKFYVAGGGGGAAGYPQPDQPKGGDGGAGGGGDGGGTDSNGNSYTGNGSDALQNTGSGGGGGPTGDFTFAGGGGSGIVLIAYPT